MRHNAGMRIGDADVLTLESIQAFFEEAKRICHVCCGNRHVNDVYTSKTWI